MRTHLTLVCTPAGFGKTTLLADWARHNDGPRVAWLSADEADNDPTRFWRYVAAALDAARSTAGTEPQTPLVHVAGASSEGMAAAIVHVLEELPTDLILVLDDYHAITRETLRVASRPYRARRTSMPSRHSAPPVEANASGPALLAAGEGSRVRVQVDRPPRRCVAVAASARRASDRSGPCRRRARDQARGGQKSG